MSKQDRDLIREEVKTLVKDLRHAWPTSDLPAELYHYTTAQGLLGILTSKSFWATDLNFQNDAMELKYASNLINEILDAKLNKHDEKLEVFCKDSRLYLRLNSGMLDAYATCFCENGNLLSQWRSYSNQGTGYSIGVLSESLKSDEPEGQGTPIGVPRLRKVIYNRELQEHLVTETIDRFFDLSLRILELSDEQDRNIMTNELNNDLAHELSEYLYSFKSPAFEEEREWRIIHTVLNYRPYDWENDILKLVMIQNL